MSCAKMIVREMVDYVASRALIHCKSSFRRKNTLVEKCSPTRYCNFIQIGQRKIDISANLDSHTQYDNHMTELVLYCF